MKEARYQLRQSPVAQRGRVPILPDAAHSHEPGRDDTRGPALVWNSADHRLKSFKRRSDPEHADVAQLVAHNLAKVGVASSSLVIRSSAEVPFRGDHSTWGQTTRGGVAERLGTGLQSRLHGFESRRHLKSTVIFTSTEQPERARLAQR